MAVISLVQAKFNNYDDIAQDTLHDKHLSSEGDGNADSIRHSGSHLPRGKCGIEDGDESMMVYSVEETCSRVSVQMSEIGRRSVGGGQNTSHTLVLILHNAHTREGTTTSYLYNPSAILPEC